MISGAINYNFCVYENNIKQCHMYTGYCSSHSAIIPATVKQCVVLAE